MKLSETFRRHLRLRDEEGMRIAPTPEQFEAMAAEVEKLESEHAAMRTALKGQVAKCPRCGGSGYTIETNTRRTCQRCVTARDVIEEVKHADEG